MIIKMRIGLEIYLKLSTIFYLLCESCQFFDYFYKTNIYKLYKDKLDTRSFSVFYIA